MLRKDLEEEELGNYAVRVATEGETKNIGKPKVTCDVSQFGKFLGVWVVTAVVLFASLMIIILVKGSSDIIHDAIQGVDALNMMFSLVLSALLEQIWSKKDSSGLLYNITLGVESILTITGAMLFIAYSIVEITSPENILLVQSFKINVGYIVASVAVVVLGFLSRAMVEKA